MMRVSNGIVQKSDNLGRVVVPKEIRRTLRIREGEPLEIFTNREGGIVLKKYSPIGELAAFAKELSNRMASTIRHNRARGSHNIELMCHIVAELDKAGMSDQWIMKNIGMDRDELLRLKQISGLADLFSDKSFSIPNPVETPVPEE